MTEEESKHIAMWLTKVRRAQNAHYEAANRARRMNLYLGCPAVILSAVTGALVFANLSGTPRYISIIVGAASVLVSILVSLQTFLRSPEAEQRHHRYAMKFGNLKRRAQQALASPPGDVPT